LNNFSINPHTKNFWTNAAGEKFLAGPVMGKFLAELLREKKSGTVCLDTFAIPIPLPQQEVHMVF
jgi:hypothetical protein